MRCAHQKYFPFAYGQVFDVIRVDTVNVSLFFHMMNVSCHDLVQRPLSLQLELEVYSPQWGTKRVPRKDVYLL
jgi:hypothetical protein